MARPQQKGTPDLPADMNMDNENWRKSRITKALTDAGLVQSFAEANARLQQVAFGVALGDDQRQTPAGQAACLTALATSIKCFGKASLACSVPETPILANIPLGKTLGEVASAMGAIVGRDLDPLTTHVLRIGEAKPHDSPWQINAWWNRWLTGSRIGYGEKPGDAGLALAGVFSGALAVRQVFADIRLGRNPTEHSVSLWRPWEAVDLSDIGPAQFILPDRYWMTGLGHLGQALIWNLVWMNMENGGYAVLQDDQYISPENRATSLLVWDDKCIRKSRLAAHWLEHAGWETELIERRHQGDIKLRPEDPALLLAGLDDVKPRRLLAKTGFDYMIDTGIGHGAYDFEAIQIRVIPKAAASAADQLWGQNEEVERRSRLLAKPAYAALEAEIGPCGTVPFADASVAAPFVGATTGALAIAQAARLASCQEVPRLLQIELATPDMVLGCEMTGRPSESIGGKRMSIST